MHGMKEVSFKQISFGNLLFLLVSTSNFLHTNENIILEVEQGDCKEHRTPNTELD